MSLPGVPVIDESIDTKNMDPELDFIDPKTEQHLIPRKAGEPVPQPPSQDLSASEWNQGATPNAFDNGTVTPASAPTAPMVEYVNTPPDDGTPESDPGPVGQQELEPEVDTEFAPELLDIAGLTEEEAIRDFGTPDAVAAAVRMLDRRDVEKGLRTPTQQETPEPDIVVEDEKWELPPPEESDSWDPDTLKLVNAMNARTEQLLAKRDAQLKTQQEYLEGMAQHQQKLEQQRAIQEFDNAVNALPEEWLAILGQGSAYDLNPEGIHFNNRLHLEETMNALQRGNTARGRSPINHDMLVVRALAVAFPEQNQYAVRQQVVNEVQDRKSLMTNRPTQRNPAPQTPDQKASAFAEEWYRKNEIPNGYAADPVF